MIKALGLVGTAAVALVVGSGSHSPSSHAPAVAAGAGVLWMNGGDGRCRRTAGAYDPANACSSFQAAYDAATCGDTVYVRDGTYPAQAIGASSEHSSCAAPVVIRSEHARNARVAAFRIGAPWVRVSNIDFGTGSVDVFGWDSTIGCHSVATAHVTVSGSVFGAIYVQNAQHLTVSRNSIGNVTNAESEVHDGTDPACPGNNELVFRGNVWHDYLNPAGGAVHMECLQLENVENTLLEGNRFRNCGQYDVFVSNGSPPGPVRNLTISNNYFDSPCSNQPVPGCAPLAALSAGPTSRQVFSNVHIVFNTFARSYPLMGVKAGALMKDDLVAYNITAGYPDSVHCGYGRWTVVKNMNSGTFARCGGDFAGTPTFVDAAPPVYNFDLAKGSRGINAIRCPAEAPATDINGTPRPVGSRLRCDLGAFELPRLH